MKRSPLLRRSELRAKPIDPKTGELRFSTFKRPTAATLSSSKPMRRTRLVSRVKVRTPEEGGDPQFLNFVRNQHCCACGALPPNHPHHEILNGRGKAQKAPDRRSLPFCFEDHDDFHLGRGRFKGWSREQKRVFQDDEITRLQTIYDDRQRLGVWQEPMPLAI